MNITPEISIAGGLQSATKPAGTTLSASGLSDGKIAYFAYAGWTPTLPFLPSSQSSQYSLLYYYQPSVPEQIGTTQGVSFNAVQNLNSKWGVFLRANNVSGTISPIETSVAWGAIYNNPFGRDPMDQVGLGFAWNKSNKQVPGAAARPHWRMGHRALLQLYDLQRPPADAEHATLVQSGAYPEHQQRCGGVHAAHHSFLLNRPTDPPIMKLKTFLKEAGRMRNQLYLTAVVATIAAAALLALSSPVSARQEGSGSSRVGDHCHPADEAAGKCQNKRNGMLMKHEATGQPDARSARQAPAR